MIDYSRFPEDRRKHLSLSEDDLDKIAERILDRVGDRHTEFEIDAEKHYRDHIELSDLLKTFNEAQNIFVKAFLSMIIVGVFAIAAFSFFPKK